MLPHIVAQFWPVYLAAIAFSNLCNSLYPFHWYPPKAYVLPVMCFHWFGPQQHVSFVIFAILCFYFLIIEGDALYFILLSFPKRVIGTSTEVILGMAG